ncbi:sugar ABC transporter substrate-binding protein [Neobacillus sp. OS1-2]|uniref:substrate-binding domain-containing protein n=1 Tax=Neobacillus sp. OS1-2 TaxID=3070680 RepID=UPI0027E19E87|nr:substrate-binding domain-containing protein [Neobacillus sp. OS1-2]WML41800.1 sugar ABC transporter substrate-binding protein [Neobacillus sp. OS1-2]
MNFKKLASTAFITITSVAVMAACSSPSRSTSASTSTALKKGDLVGISMPTKADQRWNVDGANLVKDLKKAGFKTKLAYANNSPSQQSNDINNLVSAGAKAIVVAAVDGTAVGPAVEQAESQGGVVVSYDRLVMNTKAVDYYVTFDLERTGILEANTIIDKLDLKGNGGKTEPLNIALFAGSDDDNNAPYFFKGAWDLLKPYFQSGQLVDPSGLVTKDTTDADWKKISVHAWDQTQAQKQMDAFMTKLGDKPLAAVLSPYDAISLGVMKSIKNARPDMSPSIPYSASNQQNKSAWPVITGQDGMDIAITNIEHGAQAQTVFKNVALLADQTTSILTQIADGKKPKSSDAPMNNGKKEVQTWLLMSDELVKNPTGEQKGLHYEVEAGFITESQYQKDISAPIIK